MNKKFQPTLLALTMATCFGANATVYKIENIDEVFKVNGTLDGSRSGFGVASNSNGKYIGGASGTFAITLSEEEEDAIINSRVDVTFQQQSDTTSRNPNPKNKPLATNFVFEFDIELQPSHIETVAETITEANTATVNSYVFGLNENDVAVGATSSAARVIADPDQSEGNASKDLPYYAYDFAQRGMIIEADGSVVIPEPTFSTYGGQSGFTAINNSGKVVGYTSVGINPVSQKVIDDRCLDSYKDVIPLEVCTGGFSLNNRITNPISYYLRAQSWDYSNGQLSNPIPLGILAEPVDDDDNRNFNSVALDINNNGVAVGRSVAFRNGNDKKSFDVAVVFNDGKITDLMDHDNDDWHSSRAVAISDNNFVVGSVTKNFSGFLRNKFFVYPLSEDSVELEFPNDLKSTESDFATNPNAINNSNIIVGNVEIDSIRSGAARRTHGFVYQHDSKTFSDLNELMTCSSLGFVTDSEGNNNKFSVELSGGNGVTISYDADIVVVDATDISDDGTIMATALVKLPKIQTQWVNDEGDVSTVPLLDYSEEVVIDSEGLPVFAVDGNGKPVTEQLPRAVILKPTSEQACDISGEGIVVESFEREGASLGWLFFILSFVGLGRWLAKK